MDFRGELSSPVVIYDHLGNTWVVNSAEPATRIISQLRKHNYHLIVLPLGMLATGEDVVTVPEVEDIVMRARMLDCLQVISKEN